MADDMDGVSLSSSVPQYNPGDQYRVKETDPDESGGGRDFYDGFMRKKKQTPAEEEKEGAKPGEEKIPDEQPNPIPVVEQVIQDDVVLSQRARQLIGQLDEPDPKTETTNPLPDREPPESPPHGHIKVQA
ncbi:MAG: hypothetical protein PHP44_10570 [Kiritimatiellae bacterium]|nr:hypothetical protein [Kiritimatiellia bacterium]MDD4736531.1 hypothetical protein [Kiritimatiellia bacterium]